MCALKLTAKAEKRLTDIIIAGQSLSYIRRKSDGKYLMDIDPNGRIKLTDKREYALSYSPEKLDLTKHTIAYLNANSDEFEVFCPNKHPGIQVDQRMVDRIVARAQSSAMGLGDPEKGPRSYDLSKYAHPDFESLINLLVSAHFGKYDIISLMTAALEIVVEDMAKPHE